MTATTVQTSEAVVLPPGIIVEGDRTTIAEAFATLCALQPVHLDARGLTCAPRSAPELSGPALALCRLPIRTIATIPGWPDPPSEMIAGWYRRSPRHAPAPPGIRELVQAPGEAFGPGGHATTTMCLEHIDLLPKGEAVDVGCGSGLLSQAWVALGKGPALACDVTPAAVDQTVRSLRAVQLADRVRVRQASIMNLEGAELAGRVLLANIPFPAHQSLLSRLGTNPPHAVVASGLRPQEAEAVVLSYSALGFRVTRRDERDGFVAISLLRQ